MSNIKSMLLIGYAAMCLSTTSALAAPVSYSFSTGTSSVGSFEILNLLGSSAALTGTFKYDASVSATRSALSRGYGSATIYDGSFYDLQGSVGGFSFFDQCGFTLAGNDMPDYPGRPAGQDWLTLNARSGPALWESAIDMSIPGELGGLVVGEFTLVNVRMFWFEGINGLGDFLDSNNLPIQLPDLRGRVALDFVRTDDPTNLANLPFYSNTVFFDGFSVQASPIPEPATYTLLLAGLGILSIARRRK
jgi:hypothetical protein